MPLIDMSKQYRTRDGRSVRILCTDGPSTWMGKPQPVLGIIIGDTHVTSWCSDGQYHPVRFNDERDLVEVPKEYIRFVNLYEHGPGRILYSSKDIAETQRRLQGINKYLETVRVVIPEPSKMTEVDDV